MYLAFLCTQTLVLLELMKLFEDFLFLILHICNVVLLSSTYPQVLRFLILVPVDIDVSRLHDLLSIANFLSAGAHRDILFNIQCRYICSNSAIR